jgi:quinoprotein glucose dehydrogenase
MALVLMLGVRYGVLAQPGTPRSATLSKEWPTYGHDPGGMRFSPLTQITPANVGRLDVAWVYHMKPAAGPRAGAAAGRARARTRRLGLQRERGHPLVVDGTMFIATPYARVVAIDPATGKEIWTFRLPSGNPSTRGVEYWPGDARTPAQIVFGRATRSCTRSTRRPGAQSGLRRQGHRRSEHAGRSCRAPGPRRLELAARRLQEPGHHGRDDAGEPAQGAGRRRPRVGHAHRQAGVDVQVGSARGRTAQRDVGRRQLEEPLRRERLGLHDVDVQRGIVYMPFGAPSVDQYGGDREGDNLFGTSSSRPTRAPESTCGTSRSCITTSGTPMWPTRRRSST